MTALVVYETSFGNTATIARAIADGIAQHVPVRIVSVEDPDAAQADDDRLVVVGGPTHAFGMSRLKTRRAAQERHDDLPQDHPGIRDWLDDLPPARPDRLYAAFDTRVASVRHLPGSAAHGAERVLQRRGHTTAVHAESFYVSDVEGPLLPGEEDRAREWGGTLGRTVVDAWARP